MAVFTSVGHSQAQTLADHLGLGQLSELEGIEGGIENTNYFLTTVQGAYVLTLFERLNAKQLPFYLYLMKHLADRGIAVPEPVSDAAGELLFEMQGKPAAVVKRLAGAAVLKPEVAHCATVGRRWHACIWWVKTSPSASPTWRGLAWCCEQAPFVAPTPERSAMGVTVTRTRLPATYGKKHSHRGLAAWPDTCRFIPRQCHVRWHPHHWVFDFYLLGLTVGCSTCASRSTTGASNGTPGVGTSRGAMPCCRPISRYGR